MSLSAIEIRDLRFAYRNQPTILEIKSFSIAVGEQVFLYGPSGSGKSTLLALIAGMLAPQFGSLNVLGTDLTKLTAAGRDRHRADEIGFIFQMFNLIPYLSNLDNVMLPGQFSTRRFERALARSGSTQAEALGLLNALDLNIEFATNRNPTLLSQGQQQRVAAARALFGEPGLIIADEPTSSLDTLARERFLKLLLNACRSSDTTLLFVSHDMSLSQQFDRSIAMQDINLVTNAVTTDV
jgi:putative ABC transport system ATP-binding protein